MTKVIYTLKKTEDACLVSLSGIDGNYIHLKM